MQPVISSSSLAGARDVICLKPTGTSYLLYFIYCSLCKCCTRLPKPGGFSTCHTLTYPSVNAYPGGGGRGRGSPGIPQGYPLQSLIVQLATLHSVEDKFDIICLQEPYFDFQHMSRATGIWTAVYPTVFKRNKQDPTPRALTLVHL
jgi:hypothetical protein